MSTNCLRERKHSEINTSYKSEYLDTTKLREQLAKTSHITYTSLTF